MSDECVVSVNPLSQRGLYAHPERPHITFNNENNTVPGRNERTCDSKKKKKAHRFCLRHGELWVVKVFTTCCVDEYWLKSRYTHAECGAHRVLVLSVSVIYRVPGDVTILVLYHRHQGRVRPRVNMAGEKKRKKGTQTWCFMGYQVTRGFHSYDESR